MNSPKKKIAFVGNSSTTMLNFRLTLMQELVQEGYEVVMITPKDNDIRFLRKLNIQFIEIEVDSKGTRICRDLHLISQLTKIYRQENFDFIFHYTIKPIIYGSIAAKRVHIPQVSIVTGIGYSFSHKNWLYYLSIALHKWALRTAKGVWFLNNEDKDFFTAKKIITPEMATVIPGEGVDTSHFIPREQMPEKFSFIYCGRMLYSKGVKLFVEAARQLRPVFPDVEWKLLGPIDVPMEDSISPKEMEDWVRDGNIKYLGVAKDVVPYLLDSSCVVLASYYHEGVPRSLMEASSMQIPIITTDWVGCHDVVTHGENGLLITPKDEEELIEAMRTMILTPQEDLQKMGVTGRKMMIRKYDITIVIAKYKDFLQSFFQR